MASAFVKSAVGSSTASTGPTRAFGSNVSAGNLICGYLQWTSTSVNLNSVTDSLGNAYTLKNNPVAQIVVRSAMFYAINIAGGACTLTFNFSGSIASAQLFHEVSGCDTSSPFDGSAMNAQNDFGTATDEATSGAITTTAAGDYIFGATSEWSSAAVPVHGTGYTTAGADFNASGGNIMGEYQIQSGAGSIAATFTYGGRGYGTQGIMAFKAAGGATFLARSNAPNLQAVKRASLY